jgi:hypothetical protein
MRRSPCIFSWDPNWPLLRLSINRARGWPPSPATLEFRNHGAEPASKSRFAEHVPSPPGKLGSPSQFPPLSSRVVQMPSFTSRGSDGNVTVSVPVWQLLPRCWATAPSAIWQETRLKAGPRATSAVEASAPSLLLMEETESPFFVRFPFVVFFTP